MEERGEIEQEEIELEMRDRGRRGEYWEWRVTLKAIEKAEMKPTTVEISKT